MVFIGLYDLCIPQHLSKNSRPPFEFDIYVRCCTECIKLVINVDCELKCVSQALMKSLNLQLECIPHFLRFLSLTLQLQLQMLGKDYFWTLHTTCLSTCFAYMNIAQNIAQCSYIVLVVLDVRSKSTTM